VTCPEIIIKAMPYATVMLSMQILSLFFFLILLATHPSNALLPYLSRATPVPQ